MSEDPDYHQQQGPPPQVALAVVQQGPPAAVVVSQPVTGGMVQPAELWMAVPQEAIGNVLPGLEYLTQLDYLFVKQHVELLEVVTGLEGSNRYDLMNKFGQLVYKARESTNCCVRNCCPCCGFEMRITDMNGVEVIHFTRPCYCCKPTMEVSCPPGNRIGSVAQQCFTCIPKFHIKNEAGITELVVKGPFFTSSCFGDVRFRIWAGSVEVGMISKKWGGLLKEAFTDADMFGIAFPVDLDAKHKAVLIAACMLIDLEYFEDRQGSQKQTVFG